MRKLVLLGLGALAVPAVALAASTASVSIVVKPSVVTYSTRTTLSGTVSSGKSGVKVQILNRPCPTSKFAPLTTTQTGTNGVWKVRIRPYQRTAYEAKVKATTSRAVNARVRPRVTLARISAGKFKTRVYAAKSFANRKAVFQRWRSASKTWERVQAVPLKFIGNGVAPTIVSGQTFETTLAGGRTVRVLLPYSQTGSCYLAGISNSIRS